MTTYTTGTGAVLTKVHDAWVCAGGWCVIHNPMPGPWELWPTNWDTIRRIMGRMCPCGYWHPAAEEYQHHNYAALVHKCCRVPWHRCAPELHYGRQYSDDPHGDPDVIDGEIVPDWKELES